MTILLDMDGVCCDLQGEIARMHDVGHLMSNWPAGFKYVNEVLGISLEEEWSFIMKNRPRLWETLPEFSWFPQLYQSLSEMGNVVFCTSPTVDPVSTSGKLIWLQHRFGRQFRDYVMTEKKHLLARDDAILVDDDEDNVAEFAANGGHGVLFPQPWNGGSTLTYDDSKVDQVVEAVRMAAALSALGPAPTVLSWNILQSLV